MTDQALFLAFGAIALVILAASSEAQAPQAPTKEASKALDIEPELTAADRLALFKQSTKSLKRMKRHIKTIKSQREALEAQAERPKSSECKSKK
jgi:hypothetical protein